MKSLHARLRLGLLLTLVVLLTGQWWVVSRSLSHLAEDLFAEEITNAADALLAALTFTEDGAAKLDTTSQKPAFQTPFSGHYFAIHTEQNTVWSRSLWDFSLPIRNVGLGQRLSERTQGPQNSHLLMITSHFIKQNRDVTIVVARDLSPLISHLRIFQMHYATASLVALIVLVALQALIVHGGLRPLETIRREIGALQSGRLTALRENVPHEIQPLVREINALLTVTTQRLVRFRHAAADLAHGLKTPLAVLSQLINHPTLQGDTSLQQQLREQLSALQNRTTKELSRARIAGSGHAGQHFALGSEVADLWRVLDRSHQPKNLVFSLQSPAEMILPFDREDMLELLGVLLDNACKWAHARILLSVHTTQDSAIFSIEDDGPGCPPERLQRITERGARLDESVPGHGIGLAIARQIVEDYKGVLSLNSSPQLGGLRVSFELPMTSSFASNTSRS